MSVNYSEEPRKVTVHSTFVQSFRPGCGPQWGRWDLMSLLIHWFIVTWRFIAALESLSLIPTVLPHKALRPGHDLIAFVCNVGRGSH